MTTAVSTLPTVLFLCTGNSCRSHMAEAWCRHFHGDRYRALSAGSIAKGLDPRMIQVMAEVGIDVTLSHTSKTLDSVLAAGERLDVVITVCPNAHDTCPVSAADGVQVVHMGFEDPPKLAATCVDESAALAHYRRVRDEIREQLEQLPSHLAAAGIHTA